MRSKVTCEVRANLGLSSNLNELLLHVKELNEKHGADCQIDFDEYRECGVVCIYTERFETDDEYKERLERLLFDVNLQAERLKSEISQIKPKESN